MGHLSIPAATVESTLAGLNRDQGLADDAGGHLQRQMLLKDLGAYIDDPQRFGERLDRYVHETTVAETNAPGRLVKGEFVRALHCLKVRDLRRGQWFRRPVKDGWSDPKLVLHQPRLRTSRQDNEIATVVTEQYPHTIDLPADAHVQLVEVR